MSKSAVDPDEFATAMQQLSAEAEKTLPPGVVAPGAALGLSKVTAGGNTQEIDRRLSQLESALTRKLNELSERLGQSKECDIAAEFRRIEEHLAAIRKTETVNQRLFDSLHDELLKYRDNFLHESLQKPFIHDLVHLYDDLTSLADQLRNSAGEQKKRGNVAQWRDNLDNAIHSLIEILHRFEVKEIDAQETVDRALHRVVSYEPADFEEEDGQIVMRLKRGFFWRGRLIRPEEVIAKRWA